MVHNLDLSMCTQYVNADGTNLTLLVRVQLKNLFVKVEVGGLLTAHKHS